MFKKKLKFLSYNVQDFFLFLDNYNNEDLNELNEKQWASFSISLKKNKPLEKIFGIQKVIKDVDPDVILLIEIGGKESLENFNQYFLDSQFFVYILPSNSERGIEIGYLVKKKLDATISSNSNYQLSSNERFSREVPELKIFYKKKLKLIILGVHLKSKLDVDGVDIEGRTKREYEVKGVKEIFKRLSGSNPKIPIIIAGDFNGIMQEEGREYEFNPLFNNTTLQDFLELTNTPFNERYTFQYFTSRPKPIQNQIDYILIQKKYEKLLNKNECFVYRYKNSYNDQILVETLKEKKDLPSDHYPLVMTLKV